MTGNIKNIKRPILITLKGSLFVTGKMTLLKQLLTGKLLFWQIIFRLHWELFWRWQEMVITFVTRNMTGNFVFQTKFGTIPDTKKNSRPTMFTVAHSIFQILS